MPTKRHTPEQVINKLREADCALGAGGAPTVCSGSLDFEGSLRGRLGSFKAIVDSWVAGGAAAYTSAHFVLVAGSGTGDLSNLVDFELNIQRDETVALPEGESPVGIYFGTSRFEGDETPSARVQVVGDYSVISNAPSGAPTVENGVTTIPVTAVAALRGSAVGTGVVEAVCILGTNGAATVCDGTMDFDGSLRGRIGAFRASVSSWKSGGDAAFTSAGFTLVAGSGTGDLSNLVEVDLTIQRDETVVLPEGQQPLGAYFGTARFEGDSTPTQVEEESKDLSDYSIAELFRMEETGEITTEELPAELERRNQS